MINKVIMINIEKDKRHEKTIADLKRFKEIDDQIWALHQESQSIKSNCPHFDREPRIVETLAFEYTPRAVCVVCGDQKNDLSLAQKISCFKEYFDYGDDEECFYTEEELLKMAEDGGYNLPRPGFKKE